MSQPFANRVALITGAAQGLGRTYALLLSSLGCSVVVNDLGGSFKGEGSPNSKAADKVVEEIKARGGKAVANYDAVSFENGPKIVKTAIDAFGRLDIVINNAGILRDISFAKMDLSKDWAMIQQVHMDGVFSVTHAAWPYFKKQNYGRVILVSSAAGIYGNFGQTNYSSMKMGLVGLCNTLAKEGEKFNCKVNVIAPLAGSRMTETIFTSEIIDALKPEFVAPLVLYLVSEANETSGALYEVGAGWAGRVRFERSEGVSFPLNFSIEDVAKNFSRISDFSKNNEYPTSPSDSFATIMSHLEKLAESTPPPPLAPAASPKAVKPSTNPNVDLATALAYNPPPITHTYTERDVTLYALGIGAGSDPLDDSELKFVYENHADFQALPTFGVVIPSSVLVNATSVPGLSFNPMMLLHGEQYTEIKAPIPTSSNETLISYPKISKLYDKGSGMLMIIDVSTKDKSGKEIIFNRYSLFIRGLGNFGGEKSPKETMVVDPPKNLPPLVVHREKTMDNQALLYRLSGDTNPLHADPEMAKSGKFPRPILHGLCTFGYASRAVLKHFANNDGIRFKAIGVRFVNPVYPGETLITEMWRCPTVANRILFRTRVAERAIYAITQAYIDLHPDPKLKAKL